MYGQEMNHFHLLLQLRLRASKCEHILHVTASRPWARRTIYSKLVSQLSVLLAEKRLPFKTRNFNAGSLLRLLNMLTADLYAMRFYCFDYYVEHFNMEQQRKGNIGSDAGKCRFNKFTEGKDAFLCWYFMQNIFDIPVIHKIAHIKLFRLSS